MHKIFNPIIAVLFFTTLVISCHPSIKSTTVKVTDDQALELKKRTLIVILPEFQSNYIDLYNQVLAEAWTLSPIKTVKYSDFANYTDVNKYSYLELEAVGSVFVAPAGMTMQDGVTPRGGYTMPEYYLELTIRKIVKDKKEEKVKGYSVAEMPLDISFDATKPGYKSKDAGVQMYTAGVITNYSPAHLYAYLRYFQQAIAAGKAPSKYQEYSNKEMKASLARDTLFVPKQLTDFGALHTGGGLLTAEDFKAYHAPYRVVSSEELNDVIKNRKGKSVFMFDHVINGNNKLVTVWEVRSGTPVHKKFTQTSRALKPKDLEAILP